MKKVLIIAGGLQIGGAERFAANISKYAPEDEYEFHYIVFEGNENVYGPEISANGGKVFTLPSPSKGYRAYINTLGELMNEHKYVAVHSHTMFNSGINLIVAKKHGVPVRIAHSHTTKTDTKVSAAQKIYEFIMKLLILTYSTHLFACGVEAGEWLFGKKAFKKKGVVIRNGIDSKSFAFDEKNRTRTREQYGIGKDAFVIGHSGTIIPLKNQKFLIELLPKIVEKKPNAKLVLLGNGEDEQIEELKVAAKECGVSDRIIFCGGVMNVNEHLSAFDVFAFPSLREGTPLALLEAQANGLPCVVSANVPDDAFVTDLIRVTSLDDKNSWIENICRANRVHAEKYSESISKAGYGTDTAYAPLYDAYSGKKVQRRPMISLSFDDARGDNAVVADEILIPLNIPATFNVTTGYVDGTCPKDMLPSEKAAMTIGDVVRLESSPVIEIALHGDRHLNTEEDILEGRRKLAQWLQKDESYKFGFASPGSGMNLIKFKSDECFYLRTQIAYMRTSLRIESMKFIRVLSRKIGRVIHWPFFYRIAYADTEMTCKDGKIVYSIPVLEDITAEQLCAIVDDCIKKKSSVTFMFHSILEKPDGVDNCTWSRERFSKFCEYIDKKRKLGEIDICTTMELFNRMA